MIDAFFLFTCKAAIVLILGLFWFVVGAGALFLVGAAVSALSKK